MDGLAAGDREALERAAADFEAQGYRVSAADAWADAALMASGARRVSSARLRATALYEAMTVNPLLGPLPETG
jgi:hypothetical protein